MRIFQRYYIQLNQSVRDKLQAFPDSKLISDFSKPVCLGVNEGGFSKRPPGPYWDKAKTLFLLWFFQNYTLSEEHEAVLEAAIHDFGIDEATFDRYFVISTETTNGRKITVNEDQFLKRELQLVTLEAIELTDELIEPNLIRQLVEYKRNQRKSRLANEGKKS